MCAYLFSGGALVPPQPSTPIALFWRSSARYLFKFLTPHGDRYVHPSSTPSLYGLSLSISHTGTSLKQPTWTPRHQHEAHGPHILLALVAAKSLPSCSWSWQTAAVGSTTAKPKTTRRITCNCELLLITAERLGYSMRLSECLPVKLCPGMEKCWYGQRCWIINFLKISVITLIPYGAERCLKHELLLYWHLVRVNVQ